MDSKPSKAHHDASDTDKEVGTTAVVVAQWDPAAEKKLMRKVDLFILPMMFLFYMLSYLDRVNIANARIQGMDKELGLDEGNRYNTAVLVSLINLNDGLPMQTCQQRIENHVLRHQLSSSSRYTSSSRSRATWCSSICGHPSIFPASCSSGVSIASTLNHFTESLVSNLCIGVITMCMGFVNSYQTLYGLRILLGLSEAGLVPGIIYVTSMYYRRHEFQRRLSFVFVATSLAGACGGVRTCPSHSLSSWAATANLRCEVTCVCDCPPVRPVWLCRMAMVSFSSLS